MLSKAQKIHFIGIGGIGMSSLALILLDRGYAVTGSDVKPSSITEKIENKGGVVFFGHNDSNLPTDTNIVIYSSSIYLPSNPEILSARQRNIPIMHRSDLVAEFLNSKSGVAVTGAHGKTTTTALSAILLAKAGLDPTVIIGGEVDAFGGNWRNGNGDFVVCEADESDGSFLKLRPVYGILTNIDKEHLDYYRNLKEVIKANKVFINNIRREGCLITCCDNPDIKKLIKGYDRKFRTYGNSKSGADLFARSVRMDRLHSSFEAVLNGRSLGTFELNIPGVHNVENSLAAILLGVEIGIDVDTVRAALASYNGAKRRFQVKGHINDIMVVEDYAHHPTEIIATIAACRNWPGRRVIGVFQPHRYSRTKFLKKQFGKSFFGLDELILTDLYSASEKPIEGVSTKVIYDEVLKSGHKKVRLIGKDEVLPALLKMLKPSDIVLVLGAGDIGEISDELVCALKTKTL